MLIDKISKIDISDLEDVKIYIDLENKIIHLGDFENLSTKFIYVKTIMEKEEGNKGDIFVNDVSRAYFRKKN